MILFFVLFFSGICKAHDKLYEDGFAPTMTDADNATEKQKSMAVIYMLWFILNSGWLIFAFIWVLANI